MRAVCLETTNQFFKVTGTHPPTLTALGVYGMSVVGRTLRSELIRRLALRHLSLAEMAALAALADFGPCAQRVVGEHIRVDPGDVTRLLAGLQRRGLVERERDAADRRRRLTSLSAAGRAELDAAVAAARTVESEALGDLTAAERRALSSALPKLLRGA